MRGLPLWSSFAPVATIISIEDPDDPRVAPFRSIRERDLVGRQGLFIAEGEVVVRVLLARSRFPVRSLFLAEKRLAALADAIDRLPDDLPVYVAPQSVMDGVAGFNMHRGILALGEALPGPETSALLASLPRRAVVAVLCGIANHDNMGGIFRNAAAFGVDALLIDSDCVDPLYRKAIRVSVGAALFVPYARLPRGDGWLGRLATAGFTPLALTPGGDAVLDAVARPDRVAVLLGAEGEGLPDAILARAVGVRIPMAPGFDSLNVATASGIAFHRLRASES